MIWILTTRFVNRLVADSTVPGCRLTSYQFEEVQQLVPLQTRVFTNVQWRIYIFILLNILDF